MENYAHRDIEQLSQQLLEARKTIEGLLKDKERLDWLDNDDFESARQNIDAAMKEIT